MRFRLVATISSAALGVILLLVIPKTIWNYALYASILLSMISMYMLVSYPPARRSGGSSDAAEIAEIGISIGFAGTSLFVSLLATGFSCLDYIQLSWATSVLACAIIVCGFIITRDAGDIVADISSQAADAENRFELVRAIGFIRAMPLTSVQITKLDLLIDSLKFGPSTTPKSSEIDNKIISMASSKDIVIDVLLIELDKLVQLRHEINRNERRYG